MTSHSNPLPLTQRQPAGCCRRKRIIAAAVALLALGIGGYALKGTGAVYAIRKALHLVPTPKPAPAQVIVNVPSTLSISPDNATTGIDPATPIVFTLDLPNGPLDPKTVSDDSVGLFRFDNRERVAARVTIDGDKLIATPLKPLEANRNYRVHLLPGIKDVKGFALAQKSLAFFTSSQPPVGVAYEQIPQTQFAGEGYTGLKIGPDGKLWASTHDGKLIRFVINPDGTLASPEKFDSLQKKENGPRLCTGFTFDPRSTPDAPIIYITHSEFGFGIDEKGSLKPVTDFTGKVSRITGSQLENVQTLVENLPRSARDHTPQQPNFGPDGALYIPCPSNTATGGKDEYWSMREEHGLSATMLRLDVNAIPANAPAINAKTTDAGGPFDVTKPGSPLTIYAYGLRMPYDLLWHSNGHLYTCINGASSGGTTPGNSQIPAIPRVNLAEHDWLFDVKPGNYYGHPNDKQGYFVLNGGNPTAGPDFNEVSDYPVGVAPDPRLVPPIMDLGMHISANGMVELQSDRFPQLKGKVFVCRYNIGSAIGLLCLGFAPDGSVNYASGNIPGTGPLTGPLDVIEDPRNGNLYVSEYFERAPSQTRITLLRPKTADGKNP